MLNLERRVHNPPSDTRMEKTCSSFFIANSYSHFSGSRFYFIGKSIHLRSRSSASSLLLTASRFNCSLFSTTSLLALIFSKCNLASLESTFFTSRRLYQCACTAMPPTATSGGISMSRTTARLTCSFSFKQLFRNKFMRFSVSLLSY